MRIPPGQQNNNLHLLHHCQRCDHNGATMRGQFSFHSGNFRVRYLKTWFWEPLHYSATCILAKYCTGFKLIWAYKKVNQVKFKDGTTCQTGPSDSSGGPLWSRLRRRRLWLQHIWMRRETIDIWQGKLWKREAMDKVWVAVSDHPSSKQLPGGKYSFKTFANHPPRWSPIRIVGEPLSPQRELGQFTIYKLNRVKIGLQQVQKWGPILSKVWVPCQNFCLAVLQWRKGGVRFQEMTWIATAYPVIRSAPLTVIGAKSRCTALHMRSEAGLEVQGSLLKHDYFLVGLAYHNFCH